jgi:hypothetical protein
VIGVCDRLPVGWLAAPDRHLERVDDEFGTDVIGDRPADHAAAERVEYRGEIHLACRGRVFGDVHDPEPVGALRVELAGDEIVVGDGVGVAAGAPATATPIDACDAGLTHEALNPLA